MIRWVGVLPFQFNPGKWKTHEQAAHAVSSVLGSSTDIPDPTDDMPSSDSDIVEEDTPRILRDLTSRDDRRPSALQQVQYLCQRCGLAVPSDFRAVQKLLSDSLASLVSADKSGASLANLRKEHETDKAEWEEFLKALQDG